MLGRTNAKYVSAVKWIALLLVTWSGVVVIALLATMIGVFMVGQRANLFRKKFPYSTHFETAAGLVPGNVVMLNGVVVGNVLEVNLSGDPADRTVNVKYDVVRRWAPMLRKGTRASIKTRGLLGDKYIELAGGLAGFFPLDGGQIGTPGWKPGEDVKDIHLWDLRSGKQLTRKITVPDVPTKLADPPPVQVALAHNGKYLAVGRGSERRGVVPDSPLRVIDTASRPAKTLLSTDWAGGSIHFTADLSRVLVC